MRAKDEQVAKEWVKEIRKHIEEANRMRAGEGSSTDLVKDTKFWKVNNSSFFIGYSLMRYQNSNLYRCQTQETSYYSSVVSLEVL